MEKGEKEYQYRVTAQVMVVRKESLMRHEGLSDEGHSGKARVG